MPTEIFTAQPLREASRAPGARVARVPPVVARSFELSSADGNWTETIIYEFTNANGDGSYPEAGLVEDPVGNFYGTTLHGGTSSEGYGTVYKLAPATGGGWTESVLYSFNRHRRRRRVAI